MKSLIFTILSLVIFVSVQAQKQSDSVAVYAVLEEVFTVCNSSNPDGENSEIINFERLSKYILYSGNDAVRKGKLACDYNKPEDHKLVDDAGKKIKTWLDNIENYKLVKYSIKKEGSSNIYMLLLTCKTTDAKKEKMFSFIKINENYLLSEIN
jgi:hypothetical protein